MLAVTMKRKADLGEPTKRPVTKRHKTSKSDLEYRTDGIINLGENCFVSSVLQVFFNQPQLREIILALPTMCDLPGSKGLALQRLLASLDKESLDIKKTCIKEFCKAFMINPYEPGDVGEFYQKLSEFILEATSNSILQEDARRILLSLEANDDGAEAESTLLTIGVDSVNSVNEAFAKLSEKRKVADLLALEISRTDYYQGQLVVSRKPIQFSEEITCEKIQQGGRYYLTGLVVNCKKEDFSHYISLVKVGSKWIKYDDDDVMEVKPKYVKTFWKTDKDSCISIYVYTKCPEYVPCKPSIPQHIADTLVDDNTEYDDNDRKTILIKMVNLLDMLSNDSIRLIDDATIPFVSLPVTYEDESCDKLYDIVSEQLAYDKDKMSIRQLEPGPDATLRLAQSSVPEGQLLADLVDIDAETPVLRVAYYIAPSKSSDFRLVSLKTIMDGRIVPVGSKWLEKPIGMTLSATYSSIKGIASCLGFHSSRTKLCTILDDYDVILLESDSWQDEFVNQVFLVDNLQLETFTTLVDSKLNEVSIDLRCRESPWGNSIAMCIDSRNTTIEIYEKIGDVLNHPLDFLQLTVLDSACETTPPLRTDSDLSSIVREMGAGERPKVILYKRLDRPLLDVEDLSPVQLVVLDEDTIMQREIFLYPEIRDLRSLVAEVIKEQNMPGYDWRFCWVDGGRVVSIFPDLASPHEAVKNDKMYAVRVPKSGLLASFYEKGEFGPSLSTAPGVTNILPDENQNGFAKRVGKELYDSDDCLAFEVISSEFWKQRFVDMKKVAPSSDTPGEVKFSMFVAVQTPNSA